MRTARSSLFLLAAGTVAFCGRMAARWAQSLERGDYYARAAREGLGLVLVVLFVAVLMSAATGWRPRGPALAAAGVAWALALLPLPPSDFWSNGGTEVVVAFTFGACSGIPVALLLARFDRAPAWADCALSTAVVLVVVALLVQGFRTAELSNRAVVLAVVLALAGAAGRLVARRRAQ